MVGVDGSENSDRAFDLALDFAEKFAASLTAIVTKDLRTIQNEIIGKYLNRAKAAKPDFTVSCMAKAGDAAFEIVNTAKEGYFDVTVLGHGGRDKIRERFLGSISEKVARSAPCTVIIVKYPRICFDIDEKWTFVRLRIVI